MTMTMRVLALFVVLLSSGVVAQNSTEPTGPCELECHDNITCVPGNSDFSEHPRPDGQPLDMHVEVRGDSVFLVV